MEKYYKKNVEATTTEVDESLSPAEWHLLCQDIQRRAAAAAEFSAEIDELGIAEGAAAQKEIATKLRRLLIDLVRDADRLP